MGCPGAWGAGVKPVRRGFKEDSGAGTVAPSPSCFAGQIFADCPGTFQGAVGVNGESLGQGTEVAIELEFFPGRG